MLTELVKEQLWKIVKGLSTLFLRAKYPSGINSSKLSSISAFQSPSVWFSHLQALTPGTFLLAAYHGLATDEL